MADIAIRNVVKRYGDTQVIHGISIDIAAGELIVIVGPSGCGNHAPAHGRRAGGHHRGDSIGGRVEPPEPMTGTSP